MPGLSLHTYVCSYHNPAFYVAYSAIPIRLSLCLPSYCPPPFNTTCCSRCHCFSMCTSVSLPIFVECSFLCRMESHQSSSHKRRHIVAWSKSVEPFAPLLQMHSSSQPNCNVAHNFYLSKPFLCLPPPLPSLSLCLSVCRWTPTAHKQLQKL